MAVTHAKVSAVADGGDTDLVQPSDWNADHVIDSIDFSGGPTITTGADAPEGAVTAPAGSLYLRANGWLYAKTSGSGDTGWRVLLVADA